MDNILYLQIKSLTDDINNVVTNLANAAAILMLTNSKVNWAGFYFYRPKTNDLLLGPYQGKLACNLIPNGEGACGIGCQTRETQRISDVNKFPGHIACDSNSQSEIVIPLVKGNRVLGVMDLDSNRLNAFSSHDQSVLEKIANVLVKNSNF